MPPAFIREAQDLLTRDRGAPLPAGAGTVQFTRLLSDADFVRVAALMEGRPEVTLRAYGDTTDLEFLRHFPMVRRAAIELVDLQDHSGLGFLPDDLDHLHFGLTRKRMSLEPLRRFRSLTRLGLVGHTKDLDVVSGLVSLTSIGLQSITLPDLELLTPLRRLRALDISLGGTNDLRLLPEIGQLVFVHLWRIKGLDDISPVGGVQTLEHLFLDSLPLVTSLPAFERTRLRKLHIESMKGLTDLAPLRTASSLREIFIAGIGKIDPEDLLPLRELRLDRATFALGSLKKNAQAEAMFNLPPSDRELHPALFP